MTREELCRTILNAQILFLADGMVKLMDHDLTVPQYIVIMTSSEHSMSYSSLSVMAYLDNALFMMSKIDIARLQHAYNPQ